VTDGGPPLAAPPAALAVLQRWWWLFVLRGAVAIAFGLLALIWPGKTAELLVLLLAAWMIVGGASSLVAVLRGDPEPRAQGRSAMLVALEGMLGVLVGAMAVVWPRPTLVVVALLAAGWSAGSGILQLMLAVRLRRELHGEWLLMLAAIASLVAAAVLFLLPTVGILSLSLLLGTYAIVIGVVIIGLGIRLWRLRPPELRTR
jgi:uncharacterized membrane protein HdeD (DUF308 family)